MRHCLFSQREFPWWFIPLDVPPLLQGVLGLFLSFFFSRSVPSVVIFPFGTPLHRGVNPFLVLPCPCPLRWPPFDCGTHTRIVLEESRDFHATHLRERDRTDARKLLPLSPLLRERGILGKGVILNQRPSPCRPFGVFDSSLARSKIAV